MKRFITYLYDYNNGTRKKNTGFVRVDIRGKEVRLELHICNANTCGTIGNVYLLIKKEEVLGVCISEVRLTNGMADVRFVISYSNIQDSGFEFSNSIGVAIRFENGYLASNWHSEEHKELEWGDFLIWEPGVIHENKEMLCLARDNVEEVTKETQLVVSKEAHLENKMISYEKIQLEDLCKLPSKHRHLCSNSFLLHGFFNYQYLVRKTQMNGEQEEINIGVPGVFEQPEKMIAGMFGFWEFEPLYDGEGKLDKKETNQEPKEGTFGAWFVKLTM